MSNGFKPKTTKKIKINKRSAITLDGKHREYLNEFIKDDVDRIPELKLERDNLQQKSADPNITLSLEERLDIKDRLKEINKTIKNCHFKKISHFLKSKTPPATHDCPQQISAHSVQPIENQRLWQKLNFFPKVVLNKKLQNKTV